LAELPGKQHGRIAGEVSMIRIAGRLEGELGHLTFRSKDPAYGFGELSVETFFHGRSKIAI
jgi:hypothetical protein